MLDDSLGIRDPRKSLVNAQTREEHPRQQAYHIENDSVHAVRNLQSRHGHAPPETGTNGRVVQSFDGEIVIK